MCILGGGFGGLYTALRLESLIWADDKKPQVRLRLQSVTQACFFYHLNSSVFFIATMISDYILQ